MIIKYRIVCKTDGYTASRYGCKTEEIISSNLTLQEAQNELLRMFNHEFEMNCANWGLAVIKTAKRVDCASPTFNDGTRTYSYDVWRYFIQAEDEE